MTETEKLIARVENLALACDMAWRATPSMPVLGPDNCPKAATEAREWPTQFVTPKTDLRTAPDRPALLHPGDVLTIERVTGKDDCLWEVRAADGRGGMWAATCFELLPPGRVWPTDQDVKRAALAMNAANVNAPGLDDPETLARAAISSISPPGREWRLIERYDSTKDGLRVNLCWKAFAGIPAHVELGVLKAEGWCNTYGRPFNGAPDYYQPLPAPPVSK